MSELAEGSTLSDLISEEFISSVSKDLGRDVSKVASELREIGSVEELAKSYLHGKREMTRMRDTSIQVPGENSSATDILEFRKRIGAPENKDGYGIAEDTPVGVKTALEGLRDLADSTHMTSAQWEGLYKAVSEAESKRAETIRSAWESETASLTENQLALADRFARQMLTPEAFEVIGAGDLSKIASIKRAMAEMAAADTRGLISADIGGDPATSGASRKSQLESRLSEIRTDPEYVKGRGVRYEELRQEMDGIYKALVSSGAIES